MMGGWRGPQAGSLSIPQEQARGIAQQWLDRFMPGNSAAQEADAFYGYYTIHMMKNGQVNGMLSSQSR